MRIELVEDGLALQEEKEKAFFKLAERVRSATDPDEVAKLENELGKIVFGG